MMSPLFTVTKGEKTRWGLEEEKKFHGRLGCPSGGFLEHVVGDEAVAFTVRSIVARLALDQESGNLTHTRETYGSMHA